MDATHAEVSSATEAARAEQRAVMTDPAHPMHAAWRAGHTAVVDRHLAPFYEKAAAGVSAITINEEGIQTTTGRLETRPAPTAENPDPLATPGSTDQPASQELSLEERAAHAERNRVVEEMLGESKDSELADMQVGYASLFSMPDGPKVYESFSPMINALGVPGDLWAIRSLAALGRICRERTNNGGRS